MSSDAPHVAMGVLGGVTGGPASYALRLARALAELPAPPRLTLLTDCPARCQALPATVDVVELPMRGGLDRLRWQHVAVPRALRRLAPDLYHDTKNALPWRLPVPAVVTVHDLAYHVVPETFGRWSRLFLKRATADAVHRARRVLVPSQATADDVARIYPRSAGRVDVVHHGIDAAPPVAPAAVEEVRTRHRLPRRYVLHVGTIQARKNVDLLIAAVRAARAQPDSADLRVVLAGRRGWCSEAAFAEVDRDDTALWLGEVPAADLPALYRGALAFASPSGYEGFGLAVADALAAGVPTLVSDRGSLPELTGDAARSLPLPGGEGGLGRDEVVARWRDAVVELADSPQLATETGERAARRARGFCWERAAEATRSSYLAAIRGR